MSLKGLRLGHDVAFSYELDVRVGRIDLCGLAFSLVGTVKIQRHDSSIPKEWVEYRFIFGSVEMVLIVCTREKSDVFQLLLVNIMAEKGCFRRMQVWYRNTSVIYSYISS
jgi:hypothetical protein